jgi:uncharacterized membrane protein YfcA
MKQIWGKLDYLLWRSGVTAGATAGAGAAAGAKTARKTTTKARRTTNTE